jgi:hypothetical protein
VKDIKLGFLIGIGVFLAMAIMGIVQAGIGRAVHRG